MSNFTIKELISSTTADRLKINNTPPPAELANLQILIAGLEQVRALLKAPMIISSGYRCPALNKAVGGAKDSDHMKGLAADFTAPDFGKPAQIVKAIAASNIKFDQVIFENKGSVWVHIGFGPAKRREVLTIDKSGTHIGVKE